MPVFHLLAGSNGAGKSTYADDVLIPVSGLPFIKAGVIAAQTWADSEAHAHEAARLAEALRRQSLTSGRSFISETVFSHESKVALVSDASALGYIVNLHVVTGPVEWPTWAPSPLVALTT